jgi:two-component system, sensor histidine kinase and response regulator
MGAILQDRHNAGSGRPTRFFGLHVKFVLLCSLILIVTSSTLSWYFIDARREAMTNNLEEIGTILLSNTVRNDHFRVAGVVLEDRATLNQFMHSLMAIDHVVYVVITGSDGGILEQQSKRVLKQSSGSPDTSERAIYPDNRISESLRQAPLTTPLITRLVLSSEQQLVPQDESSDWFLPFFARQETLFDFAMPVLRESSLETSLTEFPMERNEKTGPTAHSNASAVVGVVRIGITDAQAKEALSAIVRNVSILTVLMIVGGILGALLLTSRITTPLRSLASAARQLAKGTEAPGPLVPTTNDEVGELTHVFNVMTQSLNDRNQAITTNLETIRRQVTQLTTAHQASTAIASANMLNMDQLLDTVLQLLAENLGFSRMTVMLNHPERNCTSFARIIGVSPELAAAACRFDIPTVSGTIGADIVTEGKPVLIHDIETVAHRMYPPTLELMRRSGVQSFVAVPLQSHGKILGYLAGDRGPLPCSEDDLHILLTIAGHVAAAIDNAKAYSDLAELTEYLEERIAQRTQELSHANAQLQGQDQRRTKYVKIVSHELRTPMTAIRSFSENMLDGVAGPLTELQRTYLARVKHSVDRLVRLADQLLDWSRPNELRLERVCIGQLAMVVADGLATVASDKRVSLTITPTEHLPCIQGDRDKLEQILWNLIGNAIKFTPPGGQVTVEFCVSPPGFVQTCVTDTGCGIDSSHLSDIFEEFSEVPSAMPASQGAQLGLYITKTLVTVHHGKIWAESQPGTGSRLYFTLPIVRSHDASTHIT